MKKIFIFTIILLCNFIPRASATVLPSNTITNTDISAGNCTIVVKSSTTIKVKFTYASSSWSVYPLLYIDKNSNHYSHSQRDGNTFYFNVPASSLSEGQHKAAWQTRQQSYYSPSSDWYNFYVAIQRNKTCCSHNPCDICIEANSPTRWEKSSNGGTSWTNISCTSRIFTEPDPTAGTILYRALNGDNTYSDIVTITYVDAVPSTIQALPTTSTKTVDESITFEADVEDDVYSYQWKKDGTDISGASNRTYTISTIKSSHAGNYTCIVSNGCNEVTTTTAKLTVNKCAQVIDFPEIPVQTYSSGLTYTLPKTTDKGLTITYQSMNSSVATISGNILTIKAPGTAIISASQIGNDDYLEATQVSRTLTVNKRSQIITFGELPDKTYEDLPFTLPQKTDEGLTISYTSTNTVVATVSGNTVTILKPGTTEIIASQAGDATHYAAAEVSQTLVVKKAVQEITFGALPSKTYGDAPFELNKVSNKNLPITYTSSDSAVAIVAENVVTIHKPGTATITATQAGDAYYLAAEPVVQTLIVNKANQSINFPALESRAFDSGDFELPLKSDKGLTIAYESSNTDVATVENNIVHITGAGTTEIIANQAGNEYYNPASSVSQSLTITKAYQTITFPELSAYTYGQKPDTLRATVNSGLPIEYESSDYSVASIEGNVLTIVGAGQCYITASVAGNENYYTAVQVERVLVVNKAQPTIDFAPIEGEFAYGNDPIALVASSNNGAVSFSSSNPEKLLIAGTNAIILGAGTFTITASLEEDANHFGASVAQEVTIKKADLTVTAENASREYGENNPIFTYTFKGFVNGDTKSDLTAAIEIKSNAVPVSPVGTYEIVTTATNDINYNIICKKGVLTIEKAPLTISTQSASREYGENNPEFVCNYKGFKNDENSAVLTSQPQPYTQAKKSSSVGKYPVYISGASAINYSIEYEIDSLEISKAPLTIKALDMTRKRLEPNPEFELSFSGFKLEDTKADLEQLPTIQCDAAINSPAGKYPIILLDDGHATNYEYTLVNGTLTIEKLQFTISVLSLDASMGNVSGGGVYVEDTTIYIQAIPNTHYHFVKWDDGSTEIKRAILVTKDATYTAIFAIDKHTITVSANDDAKGTVSGTGEYEYGSNAVLSANPKDGYHFAKWSDGVTNNPRTVFVAGDMTYVAVFENNIYSIAKYTDSEKGTIYGPDQARYLDNVTLTAIPNNGYHFTQWTDGNLDNPRSFVLMQDTAFTAEFAINIYTVQFFGFEDVLLDSQSVEHGQNAIAPEAPTIEGLEFIGWDKEFTNVTSDLDIYAIYRDNTEGIDEILVTEGATKLYLDGVIYILRGEKVYTVTGQEVR